MLQNLEPIDNDLTLSSTICTLHVMLFIFLHPVRRPVQGICDPELGREHPRCDDDGIFLAVEPAWAIPFK